MEVHICLNVDLYFLEYFEVQDLAGKSPVFSLGIPDRQIGGFANLQFLRKGI